MSISDQCRLHTQNDAEMRKTGVSLAKSLYHWDGTILLHGELGAGKTTLIQGLAEGLGITERVTSPTYALEQRYGDRLSHIDLYRLTPEQAADFLKDLDPFPGLRVIEWSDRAGIVDAGIVITIDEKKESRSLTIDCSDIAIPTKKEIDGWIKDVHLPPHLVRHMKLVADVAGRVADHLEKNGRVIRRKALEAAALTHDLLRFVDFPSMTGDAYYTPTANETAIWTGLQETYGAPHEHAAQQFLIEKKYPDIGTIVRTHRGGGKFLTHMPQTIEQLVLCYSDKRAAHDKLVSLDQRFDDFIQRYGKGKESAEAKVWRAYIKEIERDFFPDGVPF